MIEEIHVKNYALIDSLEISFAPGLNVLSGETGAGKSILLGSLGLILGQRGDIGIIRQGQEMVEVSGIVGVTNPEAAQWLAGKGISPDDGSIILRRVIKKTGRGGCFVQGVPVTRGDLEELTAGLVDIHGQHEHQSLMAIENHRKVLDRFAGCSDLDNALYQRFVQMTALRKEWERLDTQERDRLREIDLLTFSIQEIDGANLRPGEEEELEARRSLLSQGEKLFHYLRVFEEGVSGEDGGALFGTRKALKPLEQIAEIDSSQGEVVRRWENAFLEMEDVVQAVRSYQNSIDFSPQRLEECEERLSEIHMLQKKYGRSIDIVLAYKDEAETKLEELRNWEANRDALRNNLRSQEKEILEIAGTLSIKRKEGARRLSKLIQERLTRLGMAKASFRVDVLRRATSSGGNSCGPHGYDRVEFLISPNAGEPLKPLRMIASGGEISRVMLALRSVLADNDAVQSLVFDEIDSGIGGEVALAVGEHLSEIAKHKQVLCITHLAPIAVRADRQIKVEKGVEGSRTLTRIHQVTGGERRVEIARMLSGDRHGEASLSHAEELLRRYQPQGY